MNDEDIHIKVRINEAIQKERNFWMLPPKVKCRRYQVQCCHECDDMKCGDNQNPLVLKIREMEKKAGGHEKTLEYLSWALKIIDTYYKETGKIEMAEAVVWKAAKAHCKEQIEGE